MTLGYLPFDRTQWESELARNRAIYAQFVQELTVNPYAKIYQDQEQKEKEEEENEKKADSKENKEKGGQLSRHTVNPLDDVRAVLCAECFYLC